MTSISLRFNHWPESARELTFTTSAVLLALLPHVPHLPYWIPVIVIASLLWRIVVELRAAALPNKWLRNAIAITALMSVLITFHTLNGLEAGTALLSIMAGMKLLETRDHRDYTILIFIAFFLLFAELLYDQSMWMLPYMAISTLFTTATLMRLHDGGAQLTYRDALKRCTWMAIQAAPLAILLFIFFPRLQGQFWTLPSRSGATSGLSDTMSPGDVSRLSLSDDVAFRVEFKGAAPPEAQRYWRAIVLHDFDGRTWSRTRLQPALPTVIPRSVAYDYRLLLEPSNQRWIPLLDAPLQWRLPHSIMLPDLQLRSAEPIAQLTAVEVQSATAYQLDQQLSSYARRMDTRLPHTTNPRSHELAQQMRQQAGDDATYINNVLRMFRQQHFYYTLEPPPLHANAVDDFLFNTRSGFCEHYASAFTVLMRAAGIPARVVTGYQGGEFNSLGNYLIVRQSDAHAWSEVWLDNKGWVRVDPTAAIAPDRVNMGLDSALSASEPVPGRLLRQFHWINSMRLSWDALNTFWKDHIIEFNAMEQQLLLSKIGIDSNDWRSLGFGLVIIFIAFFVTLLAYLTWKFRSVAIDPVQREYLRLQNRLEKYQIVRQPHEGPYDFLARAAKLHPSGAMILKEIRDIYIALRYQPQPDQERLSRLRELVNAM
ncbi:MAG: DUF3488 and transglutaminase-like domain-containing protein [Steroidobacter sp.]